MKEWFEIVAEDGGVIGCATRQACHRTQVLLHRVVHVVVKDGAGRWLLQKRSPRKDIQPDKWDTSVGGHVMPGEACAAAAQRELREELGIVRKSLDEVHQYLWRSEVESELVTTFVCRHEGGVTFDPDEVEDARWWTRAEIEAALGSGVFTPNFEDEYRRFEKNCGVR